VDLQEMASSPNGIILITGPTGAGKSTTLKYTMQWLNANYPHLNILTVEDPPEYPIIGATQIPVLVQDDDVDDLGGRSRAYGSVIATTLRLDPDVLMIGEIRDGSSAIAAMRAAETGHRVWSTLHANDAWETVTRMTDLLREGEMDEPLSVLANTQNLTGLVAQRLVPKLCPDCKIPLSENRDKLSDAVLMELMAAISNFDEKKVFLRGDGCLTCVPHAKGDKQKQHADNRKGIKGRTVVCEVIRPDQPLLDTARNKGIPQARRYWLKYKGGRTIIDHALEKIMDGVIDPAVAREFVGPLISGQQSLASMESVIDE
jgi:type II secretory ATPase GspE/PulE/Tfp pilus assembly ATPase PilB-like protein